MKARLLALAAAGAVFAAAAPAAAAEGWYISGQFGVGMMPSQPIDDGATALPGGGDMDLDLGLGAAGAAGYYWNKFRVETEVAFTENDISSFDVSGPDVNGGGDVTSLSVLASAYRDFAFGDLWSVNLGGGIGFANIAMNETSADGAAFVDEDSVEFAWQLGAGMGFAVTRRMTLTLDYRYFATTDPSFDGEDGQTVTTEYSRQDLRLGVRYKF